MGNRPFTLIAALIFAVMAVIHIIRMVTKFDVVIGTHSIPMWCSIVAIVVTAILSWGLFKESRA